MSPTKGDRPSPFEAACRIRRRLVDAGHETWLVGGAVRDVQLGQAPETLREVDVATAALPDEVEALFRRTIAVGKAFGVIQVGSGPEWVEVATFREDKDYVDGRRPEEVRFTTAEVDVRRRDFTINGLLWDPDEDEIRDYVGGREDLAARRVRAIGDPDERFKEDRLRMLRAVRFGACRDFVLDEATEAAIIRHAPAIEEVSSERVHDELSKIAQRAESRLGDAWRSLVKTGLAKLVLPEVDMEGAGEANAQVLDRLGPSDLASFLAVTLRAALPAGSAPAEWEALGTRVGERLRASKEETRALASLLRGRARYRSIGQARLARQRLAATRADHGMHEALLAAEGDAAGILELLRQLRADFPVRPKPLLNGGDLMRGGMRPGPLLGWSLRRLKLAQLQGAVASREDACALLGLKS